MATATHARHVVVDGSNLATEGRTLPSLKQLNEAVLAYMDDHPDDVVTVVVDATFGHRIDPREVAEFDAAVENNELVAPPAGAIGRGDAFVLTIANKVQATIISNDSYQEFHGGEYDWLFDEGRLIGGKPVPNVGWVFVPRVPVRGPISRRAVKDSKRVVKGTPRAAPVAKRASKEASRPMPVPSTPPPGGRGRSASRTRSQPAPVPAAEKVPPKPTEQTDAPTATRPHMVNELLPFLGFVERHPVGSTVPAVVESYSSHGAYVAIDEARGYVPLRLMADPAPRSARSVMKLGATVDLVVVSFNATRRSIDLCVPGMEPPEVKAAAREPARPVKRTRKKAAAAPAVEAAAAETQPAAMADSVDEASSPTAPAPAKRTRKKAVASPAPTKVDAVESVESVETVETDGTVGTAPLPPPVAPPVKRTRKKAAAPAAESTIPAEPLAPPVPAKRTRKKAAAPAPAAAGAPAPPAAPVKRTRKKATAS